VVSIVDYIEYRNADFGAVTIEELLDCLGDNCTGVTNIRKRIEHFGVYERSYEVKVNRLRALVENSYKYMTLNTFKQRVPRETLLDFKETMADVTSIVRRNKEERELE
tara:strand:+ start:612 stop:935 length:324 start_codon:yes stop_codon:yes gene_type:complete